MKALVSWLRDFVAFDEQPRALADRLSLAGVAVERVEGDVLDLDLTSNRPDQLSHYGVAREIAALLDRPLAPLTSPALMVGPGRIGVTIEDQVACGRYCALVFDGVRVGDSPPALADRLTALGQRPINNVADLTNYTLWEMGHPTHAFDADTLRGGEIRVRRARPGEKLTTLDGVERALTAADLVIADAERPVALAGVMGGLETAIGPATRRVVLESAWFDPLTVRQMARRHGLHTDASHRFERGADPAAAPLAAARIAQRLGIAPSGNLVEAGGHLPKPATIRLRPGAVERMLGRGIAEAECARILAGLGCVRRGDAWLAPSWRPDLTREIDLIEELARLHGYDRFPARLPAFQGAPAPLPEAAMRDRVRTQLRGRGFAEAVSISFANPAECAQYAPDAAPVVVNNPLNEEQAILRTSSLPAMARLLRYNLHHGVAAPRLFEIGKLYDVVAGQPRERAVLAVGAADESLSLRAFKGEIAAVLALFEAADFEHSVRLERPDARTWLAEVALDRLYALGPRAVRYQPPPRFPAADRDFSFLFEDRIRWAALESALRADPPIPFLAAITPAEIFRGSSLPAGHYSLLVRARFQSPDRTLLDADLQAASQEIVRRLRALGGVQR